MCSQPKRAKFLNVFHSFLFLQIKHALIFKIAPTFMVLLQSKYVFAKFVYHFLTFKIIFIILLVLRNHYRIVVKIFYSLLNLNPVLLPICGHKKSFNIQQNPNFWNMYTQCVRVCVFLWINFDGATSYFFLRLKNNIKISNFMNMI